MLDSWGAFDTAIKLSEQALASNKFKKFSNLSQLVHENFFKYDKDYRNYKSDTIEKSANTEDMFNGTTFDENKGENVPNFCYNDAWADKQMSRYSDIMERLDDGIEANSSSQCSNQSRKFGNINLLISVAKADFASIENTVKKL